MCDQLINQFRNVWRWLTNQGYCFSLIMFSVFCGWVWNEILNSEREIKSAWIQGGCIAFTGICALWAGYKAYQSSMTKIELDIEKEEKRRIAYRFMMKNVLENLFNTIKKCEGEYIFGEIKKELVIFLIPDEIQPKNWEYFSFLKKSEIILLNQLFVILNQNDIYAEFFNQCDNTDLYLSVSFSDDPKDQFYAQESFKNIEKYKNSSKGKVFNSICKQMDINEYLDNINRALNIIEELFLSLTDSN